MTPTETAAKLQHFNDWRRGHHDDTAQPDPREIGEAIDAAVEMIDRLEAAESDALEQARLNGMGSEREAALMVKLEAAKKERDNANAAAAGIALQAETLQAERDALLARVEAMERQKPVGWFARIDGDGPLMECKHADISRVPLYLAPGAQPAPIIPEGWKPVPIEVIDLYRFMCAAFVPMTPQQEQIALQLDLTKRAMLAVVPEAKP